ncbi:MAG TPA: cellulase family glycosylhydrolase [Chitinophagaceae bacterium]|nr:cellulase family glycosylhydrolase [Chitinophagaceae bacterium]
MLTVKLSGSVTEPDPQLAGRWSAERANAWYEEHGWLAGCNYIPSSAINQLEMWQPETFDPVRIDMELGWAESLGFNTIRVFLHHLLWEQDPLGFLHRLDQFLAIAHRRQLGTMFVLFDAVWDPYPLLGKQPDPKPGVHNSGWVQSPGFHILKDTSKYDALQGYVEGVVGRFGKDPRVVIWDLFNEPDNINKTSYNDCGYGVEKAELSMHLLKKTITWVRALNPIQPLTAAPWKDDDWSDHGQLSPLDNYMFTHSDVISFHCYENKAGIESRIRALKQFNRPIFCTEYMARPFGSTFEEVMPLLKEHNVGCYNWGFVAGKTQTHYPWDSWANSYATEPELWFHDIFRENGVAYDPKEVEVIRELTRKEVRAYQKVA